MRIILVFFFLAFGLKGMAQQKYNSKDFAKKPLWIYMMNDQNPNYFEVVNAYETYWANHTLPEAEGDMDIDKKDSNKRRFSKKEVNEARQQAAMRMQIKKYKWWIARMEAFVQEDGTIIRPTSN